jgi:hypothetical protein
MTLRLLAPFAAAAAIGLASAPALAIESLTGTYEGKATCKGVFGDATTKEKYDLTIQILEAEGIVLTTRFGDLPNTDVFRGYVVELAKLDRGKVAAVSCTLGATDLTGISLQGDVVIKPGSANGTIKGSLTLFVPPTVVDVCTFTVKRTATAVAKLEGCPAL